MVNVNVENLVKELEKLRTTDTLIKVYFIDDKNYTIKFVNYKTRQKYFTIRKRIDREKDHADHYENAKNTAD